MKKLLALALLLLCNTASAEWIRYHKDKDSGIVDYYNPSSIRDANNRLVVKIMYNLPKPMQVGIFEKVASMQYIVAYQCKVSKYQIIGVSLYASNMARGTVLYSKSGGDGRWVDTPDNSPFQKALPVVCAEAKKQFKIAMANAEAEYEVAEPK